MMMRNSVRRILWRTGIDVRRYPGSHPLAPVVTALHHRGVQMVVDVGANDGGYARELRDLGYRGSIVSFEPVRSAYLSASQRSTSDSRWQVLPYALGAEEAELTMNVAANHAASSSVLPMLPRHELAAPEARIVGQEVVRQRVLDDIWEWAVGSQRPAFLKIDVQGYEQYVLAGAEKVLKDGLVLGLQLELSYVDLYEGGWRQVEAVAWAEAHGFELHRLVPGFTEPSTGRMLQADGVFFPRI